MSIKLLISVIVPVYKVEPYLRKCVDSILAQTYTNLEVILIDDGSPDNCPAICDEYAVKDSRIKVIHQQNAGVSAARNAGLDAATGEYIGFVDSDDWIEPDMYEVMLCRMLEKRAEISGIVYCIDTKDKEGKALRGTQDRVFNKEEIINEALSFGRIVQAMCGYLFSSELIKGIRFAKDISMAEDFLFCFTAFTKANTMVFTDYCAYHYFQRSGSAVHTLNEKYWSILTANDIILSITKHSFSEAVPWAEARCIRSALSLAIFAADGGQLTEQNYERLRLYLAEHSNQEAYSRLPASFKLWFLLFKCGKAAFGIVRKCWKTLLTKRAIA